MLSAWFQNRDVPEGDYWPFVRGLKWIHPVVAPSIERISRLSQGCDEDSKGRTWLRDSLFDHALSEQLKLLASNQQHLATHYHGKNRSGMNEWMFNDTPSRKADRLLDVRIS